MRSASVHAPFGRQSDAKIDKSNFWCKWCSSKQKKQSISRSLARIRRKIHLAELMIDDTLL